MILRKKHSDAVRELPRIGVVLDLESVELLDEQYPGLTTMIEEEIADGATPRDVYRYIIRVYQRKELALRAEQAARALVAGGE